MTSLKCLWSSDGRVERTLWYRAAGPNGKPTFSALTIRRAAHKRCALLLIKYLNGRDMQSRSRVSAGGLMAPMVVFF